MAYSQTAETDAILRKLPALEPARLLPALHEAHLREEGLLPVVTLHNRSGVAHHGRLIDYEDKGRVVIRRVEGTRETNDLVYVGVSDIESVRVHNGHELLPELSGRKHGAYEGQSLSKMDVLRKLNTFAQDLEQHRRLRVTWKMAADDPGQRLGYDRLLSHAANLNRALRQLTLDDFTQSELSRQVSAIEMRYGPSQVTRQGKQLVVFVDERTPFTTDYRPLVSDAL